MVPTLNPSRRGHAAMGHGGVEKREGDLPKRRRDPEEAIEGTREERGRVSPELPCLKSKDRRGRGGWECGGELGYIKVGPGQARRPAGVGRRAWRLPVRCPVSGERYDARGWRSLAESGT